MIRTPLLLLALATSAHAQSVHKCVGADGRTSFSDVPCANGQKSTPMQLPGNAGGAAPPRGDARSCKSFEGLAQLRGHGMRARFGDEFVTYMDLARSCDEHRQATAGKSAAQACDSIEREVKTAFDPARADAVDIAVLRAAQNGCRTDDLRRVLRAIHAQRQRGAAAPAGAEPVEQRRPRAEALRSRTAASILLARPALLPALTICGAFAQPGWPPAATISADKIVLTSATPRPS